MPNPEHQAITTIWRMEGARIIAGVARLTRDIGLAEELAGDALVAALETWPGNGIPDNPGAWLMATAKNRALDHLRRQKLQGEKYDQFGRELETLGAMTMPDYFDLRAAAEENPLGDDLLRLMCIACHPYISCQPHRIRAFERALRHVVSHDDVWLATGAEIAQWYRAHHLDEVLEWLDART